MTAKLQKDDRVVDYLRSAITDGTAGLCDVPALVKRVIKENLWQERYVQKTKERICFSDFIEFVRTPPPEGLGTTLKTIQKLCSSDITAIDLLDRIQKKKRGGDRRSRKFQEEIIKVDNTKLERPSGTSRQYALRRLRQNKPDLYQKVLLSEISAHQAMIKAGFRKKHIYITEDITQTGQILLKNFNNEEIRRLIKYLSIKITNSQ
jgi:hypothetical protein